MLLGPWAGLSQRSGASLSRGVDCGRWVGWAGLMMLSLRTWTELVLYFVVEEAPLLSSDPQSLSLSPQTPSLSLSLSLLFNEAKVSVSSLELSID